MTRLMLKPLLLGLMSAAVAAVALHAQQPPADVVLTTGKIITVDGKFTVAQAVAIRGDRFVAVGSNADIGRLAGPNTRRIDLGGKSVIPGLIDAHAPLTRGADTRITEARFDDVASRKHALDIVRANATELGAGRFVYNLGGWSYDQFADNPTPLTKAELDAAAPNNPVYVQFSRCCAFMNGRAIDQLGVDAIKEPWVERDAAGKPTGRINDPGLAQVAAKIQPKARDPYPVSAAAMLKDLNRVGLTAANMVGCPDEQKEAYLEMQRKGELTFRVMCMVGPSAGTPENNLQQMVASLGRA